ncbi:MAG: RIP metalloprotease RseP [Candidatus Omnitrophica bacterium]|nr:RIP metalloprotease RseP [Candidatus Omnitrophota bacterium]MDD5487587.1 RIP metalloprotease RseP [Candidatus Omnitrophota bacterium]
MTLIVALVVFSILVMVHEIGHLVAAKRFGITVEVFSIGMGKKLLGWTVGGTEYRLSLIPFGGYCKMSGEEPGEATGKEGEYPLSPAGHRFWVIAAGSLVNYLFAFFLFWIIFMIGVPTLSNKVGQVLGGYPAEKAGIEVGDEILSINTHDVKYWDDIVGAIKEDHETSEELDLRVVRNGNVLRINIKPEISTVTNIFGQRISRPMIGIAPESDILSVSYGPGGAFYHAGKRLLTLTAATYKSIWLLITGGLPVKDSVSGPIGIASLMGRAAKLGIVPLLIITAHVSMALAIFNLLPFPVLDGGHIIFIALEKFRGRPVSVKVQENVTQVALYLLITLAVFISWQDISKLIPRAKNAPDVTAVEKTGADITSGGNASAGGK